MDDESETPREETPELTDERLERIRAVKSVHESRLLGMANVVGVGIGFRVRAGELTTQPAIIVSVSDKLPPEQLGPGEAIPTELDGVPVDVQAIGRLTAF